MRAFTLIEVLISVLIVSITAIALLDLQSSGIKLFNYNTQKEVDYKTASAIYSILDIKYHKTEKSLYDLIKTKYNISNFDIKKELDSKKVSILVRKETKEENKIPITIEEYNIGSVWVNKIKK
jgi:prepilin-type N-terminal cleavage/methylation domain-containing protein